MIFVSSMREIETSNIHASFKKLLDHFNRSGSRTQSTDDFGLRKSGIIGYLVHDLFNVNVRHFYFFFFLFYLNMLTQREDY